MNPDQSRQRNVPAQPIPPPPSRPHPAYPATRRPRAAIPPTGRSSCWLWGLVIAGLALTCVSLTVNAVLILELLHASDVTGGVLDEAISALDDIPQEGVDVSFPISQTIHFSSTFPFSGDFDFPFKQDFSINQTVRVSVDAGVLGRIPLDIPINATIPISMTVPVHIDQEFPVQAEVPVQMDVPFHFDPEEMGVINIIATVRRWLATIRALM